MVVSFEKEALYAELMSLLFRNAGKFKSSLKYFYNCRFMILFVYILGILVIRKLLHMRLAQFHLVLLFIANVAPNIDS
jgi:hypothetical protein